MFQTLSKEHIHSILQLIWKKEDDEYAEQFYNDDTVNSGKNISFKISFLPFGSVISPKLND